MLHEYRYNKIMSTHDIFNSAFDENADAFPPLSGEHPLVDKEAAKAMMKTMKTKLKEVACLASMLGLIFVGVGINPTDAKIKVSGFNNLEGRMLLNSADSSILKACRMYCGEKDTGSDGVETDQAPLNSSVIKSGKEKALDFKLLKQSLQDLKWLYGPPPLHQTHSRRNLSRKETEDSIKSYAIAGYRISPRLARFFWPTYPSCTEKMKIVAPLLNKAHVPFCHDYRVTNKRNKALEDHQIILVPSRAPRDIKNVMYRDVPHVTDLRCATSDAGRKKKKSRLNNYLSNSEMVRTCPINSSQISELLVRESDTSECDSDSNICESDSST
jgi:hypothetical protein